jgi:hypothetical protein
MPQRLNRFVVSEINSESEQARGPNPWNVRECIQKFPDWQPGARAANGTALCH